MTDLDLRPVAEGRTKADPDSSHLYCCTAEVSLCGLDISDANDVDFADEECCPVCLGIADLPCGPGCWDRTPNRAEASA